MARGYNFILFLRYYSSNNYNNVFPYLLCTKFSLQYIRDAQETRKRSDIQPVSFLIIMFKHIHVDDTLIVTFALLGLPPSLIISLTV